MEMSTRRRRIKHKITQRDYRILQLVRDTKFETREKIRRAFWPGKNNNHHHRRVRVLLRMGLIYRARGSEKLYKLSKKGRNELGGFPLQCNRKLAS